MTNMGLGWSHTMSKSFGHFDIEEHQGNQADQSDHIMFLILFVSRMSILWHINTKWTRAPWMSILGHDDYKISKSCEGNSASSALTFGHRPRALKWPFIEFTVFVHQKYFKEKKQSFDELLTYATSPRKHFIEFYKLPPFSNEFFFFA